MYSQLPDALFKDLVSENKVPNWKHSFNIYFPGSCKGTINKL